MSAQDRELAVRLDRLLTTFGARHHRLPGVSSDARRACFVGQLVESERRVRYVATIREREISPLRADPSNALFDPIRAAILNLQNGVVDEASWLIFLSVHFGKALKTGWSLARAVYGGLDQGAWSWARTRSRPKDFRTWLAKNQGKIEAMGYRFGNHRKYQSLDAKKERGTGDAVESYVRWVVAKGSHRELFDDAIGARDGDAGLAFDELYESMKNVSSFGRMARFDYLTMVGKVGVAAIEPASTYMDGATGPLTGAQLLFGKKVSRRFRRAELDQWVVELGRHLGMGMQEMEDAICNWQKSPSKFKRFRG